VSTMRSSGQNRCQSVTHKDIKVSIKLKMEKRSSSKTKGLSRDKHSFVEPGLANIGKAIKAELDN